MQAIGKFVVSQLLPVLGKIEWNACIAYYMHITCVDLDLLGHLYAPINPILIVIWYN